MVDNAKRKTLSGLRDHHQAYLLSLARDSVVAHLRNLPRLDVNPTDAVLRERRGVFVTIQREGSLRGCTGTVEPCDPLYKAVIDFAIASAISDPRFQPLTLPELSEVEFEISALSQLQPLVEIGELVMHHEGLLVRSGKKFGVLLPQVASRNAMTREAFFEATCAKAGIDPQQHPLSALELFAFTTTTFHESGRGEWSEP